MKPLEARFKVGLVGGSGYLPLDPGVEVLVPGAFVWDDAEELLLCPPLVVVSGGVDKGAGCDF